MIRRFLVARFRLLLARVMSPVARAVASLLRDPAVAGKVFSTFEKYDVHLTPAHFYAPVPDLRELSPELWSQPSELPGIDLRPAAQLALLEQLAPYAPELEGLQFDFDNNAFAHSDAPALYAMIRHLRPRRVIEVGSGHSSLLAAAALQRNGSGALRCIDPYPPSWLRGDFEIVRSRVQDLGVGAFADLAANDILFIDSSHVVKIGSDVNFLFLEVLPRLASGVVAHVHDIFLPYEMPQQWVLEQRLFWNEQYLLQAFLAFNSAFEVLLGNHYLQRHHHDALKKAFPRAPHAGGGSFWMRRV